VECVDLTRTSINEAFFFLIFFFQGLVLCLNFFLIFMSLLLLKVLAQKAPASSSTEAMRHENSKLEGSFF